MSQVAFIFVHNGSKDPESKNLLEQLKKSGTEGITKINANNPKIKQQLESNTKGIVVKKYPAFLVAQEGKTTQVYSGDEIGTVLEMVKKITGL